MKKLHFWDHILLILCALTALLCGLYLIYASLPRLNWAFLKGTFVENLPLPNPLFPACAGLLSVLLSIFLFLLPRRLFTHRRDFVVQKTENGELRIAVKAIESLVQKCVDMHEEARMVRMRVHTTGSGVVISLCISLANNISIPLAVASLQKQIKQYLLASSGIDVREVRVTVETALDMADHSPYMVPAEEAEKQPLEQKEKKKRPTHQRLFSRPDEPAVMPAAPKADENAAAPAAEAGNGTPIEEAPETAAEDARPEEPPAETPAAQAPAGPEETEEIAHE